MRTTPNARADVPTIDAQKVVQLSVKGAAALSDAVDDELYGFSLGLESISLGHDYCARDLRDLVTVLSRLEHALTSVETGEIVAHDLVPFVGRLAANRDSQLDLAETASHPDDAAAHQALVDGYDEILAIAATAAPGAGATVAVELTEAEAELLADFVDTDFELMTTCGLRTPLRSSGDAVSLAAQLSLLAQMRQFADAGGGSVDAALLAEVWRFRANQLDRLHTDAQCGEVQLAESRADIAVLDGLLNRLTEVTA